MRKRTTKKAAAAKNLTTPPTPVSDTAAERSPTLSPAKSPETLFDFNLNGLKNIASSSKNKRNEKLMNPTGLSPQTLQSLKNVSTISDLKKMATSNLNCIKRKLEMSHSEILKDIEASQSRLRKRYKQRQTQACQQVMDEAEKEYEKISERIKDGQEAMMASYAEFIAEAQTTASRRKLFAKHLSLCFNKLVRKELLHLGADMGSHPPWFDKWSSEIKLSFVSYSSDD
ncbi:uncharacterized protein [Primulina huaijiensis]|uniref:uncharacterized protein n=1 Tax=Primulina huaijiensis TaxID=1492673 RepID=UPI003CC7780B